MTGIKSLLYGTLFLSLALIASAEYKLVWQDEFNGNSLDRSKWQYEVDCNGGGNNELQCYTTSNVQVRDGSLYVTARPENYNGKQYTSGRINTKASAAWKYGRFEIRAKLPRGDYLWPALWMLPRDSVYGGWAASGEIDIMEARGQSPTKSESTLHHGGAWPNNVYTGSGPIDFGVDLSADFHTYTLTWERDQMQFALDGRVYHTANLNRGWYSGRGANPYNANRQPFDQPFFFIINLAIGGGFFGGQANALNPQIAQQWRSPSLVVDYVRVYQDNGTPVVNPVPVPQTTPKPTPAPVASSTQQQTPKPSSAATPAPVPTSSDSAACPRGCGASEKCCNDGRIGGICFNPLTHSCTVDAYNQAKSYLCAKGNGACKGACFDSSKYRCDGGRISLI